MPAEKTDASVDKSGRLRPRSVRPAPEGHITGRIFTVSIAVHALAVIVLAVLVESTNEVSRDAFWYDANAQRTAEAYATGEVNWSNWIDEGWEELLGLTYYLFGPNPLIVLLLNALLASASAVLVYKIASVVFRSTAVAVASAYSFALFPSFVYFTSLPLKDAAAVFAVLCIVWGLVTVIDRPRPLAWFSIVAGLMIVAGVRVYLVPVFAGCIALCLLPIPIKPGIAGAFQVALSALLLVVIARLVLAKSRADLGNSEATQYLNLDKVNEVRMSMARGNTRLFEHRSDAAFTDDWIGNILKLLKGVAFFFLSIDVMDLTQPRQLAAVPEMHFFLFSVRYLLQGLVTSWNRMPRRVLPLIVFGLVILAVYSSVTTNAGTLYRWRLQGLSFFVMLVMYGAAVRRRGYLYNLALRQNSWVNLVAVGGLGMGFLRHGRAKE